MMGLPDLLDSRGREAITREEQHGFAGVIF